MALLITEDRAFESIMLEDYPDRLRASQIEKREIGYRHKAYIFKNLKKEVIEDFLKKYKPSGYTILCHTSS